MREQPQLGSYEHTLKSFALICLQLSWTEKRLLCEKDLGSVRALEN